MRAIASDPTKADLKDVGLAVRAGFHHGELHTSGSIVCRHCGGYIGSQTRIATAIGVPLSTLFRWLKRETIRQDLAERIRSSFARIEE